MKIVKGDTVYLRSGKDVADMPESRLKAALHMTSGPDFQARREQLPMSEQISLANKEKGVRGRVVRVLQREGKVVVEGLNQVTKHKKSSATGGAAQVQQGGRIKMEAPIPISRVMLVCPHCDRPTRIGTRMVTEDRQTLNGHKQKVVRERVCKHKDCGNVIERPTDTRLG